MGQPEFQTIVAAAPREELVSKDLTTSATVAAGAVESITVYAPSGQISKLQALAIDIPVPAGGLSGHHNMYVQYSIANLTSMFADSNYNVKIVFRNSQWEIADITKAPTAEVVTTLQGFEFDDVIGLTFYYSNATDVAQTGTRLVKIALKNRQLG